jgi:hypothetical protein
VTPSRRSERLLQVGRTLLTTSNIFNCAAEPIIGGVDERSALVVALALTALSSLPARSRSSCPAALETDDYSDTSHTTKVGMCVITCRQWDLDPGAPGKRTGTITAYSAGGPLRMCPCPP